MFICAAPPCNRDFSGVKGSGECGRWSGGRRGGGGAERRSYTARRPRTEPSARARTPKTTISGCAGGRMISSEHKTFKDISVVLTDRPDRFAPVSTQMFFQGDAVYPDVCSKTGL